MNHPEMNMPIGYDVATREGSLHIDVITAEDRALPANDVRIKRIPFCFAFASRKNGSYSRDARVESARIRLPSPGGAAMLTGNGRDSRCACRDWQAPMRADAPRPRRVMHPHPPGRPRKPKHLNPQPTRSFYFDAGFECTSSGLFQVKSTDLSDVQCIERRIFHHPLRSSDESRRGRNVEPVSGDSLRVDLRRALYVPFDVVLRVTDFSLRAV